MREQTAAILGSVPVRPSWARRAGAAALALALAWGAGAALGRGDPSSGSASGSERPGEVDLMRLEYDSAGGAQEAYYFAYGRAWERWETDYPEAERNFARRLAKLSRVQPGIVGKSVRIDDDSLFDHPFVFLSDVGWMKLSPQDRERFREYLLRGGFAWVDDFWGDAEWDNFAREMSGVFPDAQWSELPADHPLLHTVFDLAEVPQIPARDFADDEYGREPAQLHRSPAGSMQPAHLRGYFDANGRLLLLATHNTDIGDGFEREAYGQFFFEHYSTRAYALGVNVMVYALTH